MATVEYDYDPLTLIQAEITATDESFDTAVSHERRTGYEVTSINIVIWNWDTDTDVTSALSAGMIKYFKDWTLDKYLSLV